MQIYLLKTQDVRATMKPSEDDGWSSRYDDSCKIETGNAGVSREDRA